MLVSEFSRAAVSESAGIACQTHKVHRHLPLKPFPLQTWRRERRSLPPSTAPAKHRPSQAPARQVPPCHAPPLPSTTPPSSAPATRRPCQAPSLPSAAPAKRRHVSNRAAAGTMTLRLHRDDRHYNQGDKEESDREAYSHQPTDGFFILPPALPPVLSPRGNAARHPSFLARETVMVHARKARSPAGDDGCEDDGACEPRSFPLVCAPLSTDPRVTQQSHPRLLNMLWAERTYIHRYGGRGQRRR